MIPNRRQLISFLFGVFVTLSVFYLLESNGGHSQAGEKFIRAKQVESSTTKLSGTRDLHLGASGLINPLLDCADQTGVSFRELKSFKSGIQKIINEFVANGNTTKVGLYFRDMNNGLWLGIDEKEPFVPASLLKVGLLIGYLKFLELDPKFFSTTLKYEEEELQREPLPQNIIPDEQMVPGNDYTVQALVERMIIYSDNLAMNVMFQKFPNISPEGVFKDLNIELTSDESTGEAEVNVYLYASFFRILYNASYLRPEFSNWALQLMTNTAFHDGLVAGVPKDVVVAHKFGERENIEGRQLHDCGIIYHPRSPYLLCIMTRGKEFNELAQVIQKLSSFVYKKVDENR